MIFDHPGPDPKIGQTKVYPSAALKIEITAFELALKVSSVYNTLLCSNQIALITGLPVIFDHPGPDLKIGQTKVYPSAALKIEITAFELALKVSSVYNTLLCSNQIA